MVHRVEFDGLVQSGSEQALQLVRTVTARYSWTMLMVIRAITVIALVEKKPLAGVSNEAMLETLFCVQAIAITVIIAQIADLCFHPIRIKAPLKYIVAELTRHKRTRVGLSTPKIL